MSINEQHIVFRSMNEIYALNVKDIQEIIKMKEICETPNCFRDYVKGVINVRGNIIPVISFSERFKKEQKKETRATRIIIMNANDSLVGIIVDEIIKVENLEIESMPETVNEELRFCSKGVSYLDNKIIPILDINSVLEMDGEINE